MLIYFQQFFATNRTFITYFAMNFKYTDKWAAFLAL